MTSPDLEARVSGWLSRWRGVLPLLVAELILWIGFGALLPVMPLYFTEHGIDIATLGLVVAAWPGARLIGEPFFGWLADRTARVPLMVVGLVAAGILAILPLLLTGAFAFFLFRFLSGLATAVYDPAARGYVVDATPQERQGEAFGLYGSAQMGGLLFGPAIGGLGAAVFGSVAFVFVFGAVTTLAAALVVALTVRELPRRTGERPRSAAIPAGGLAELRPEHSVVPRRAFFSGPGSSAPPVSAPPEPPGSRPLMSDPETSAAGSMDMPADHETPRPPASLWNRMLVAAIIVNVGGFFAAGTYEVVWSLYLRSKGAGLDLIGLTFAMFGLPVLVLSPYAGRLVDRRGSLVFIVVGSLAAALTGILYTLVSNPLAVIPILLIEGAAFAFLNPAIYAVVAQGSPAGRSSTAQGFFGAAGTIGFILASIWAGYLAAIDLRFPFYLFSAVMIGSVLAALAVGYRAIVRGDSATNDRSRVRALRST